MALPTLADYSAFLKTQFNNKLITTVNDDNNTWSLFTQKFNRSAIAETGFTMVAAVETGYGSGYGALTDGSSDLPDWGNPNASQATVQPKRLAHRTAYPQDLFYLAESNKKAFQEQVEMRKEAQMRHLKRHLNRMVFGRNTGALCQAATTVTGTALVVNNFVTGRPIAKLFNIGDRIDVWTTESVGGTQQVTNVKITGVNSATNTITLETSQSWSAGSYVFFANCRNNELTGLPQAIDDGTVLDNYFGIFRSTTPSWKSLTVTTPTTAATLNEANSLIHLAGKDKLPTQATTTFEIRNTLWNQAEAARRYVTAPDERVKRYNAGADDGLQLAYGIPVSADQDCNTGTFYAYSTEDMNLYSPMSQPEYLEEDGSIFFRIANKAAYETTLYFLLEIFNGRPNACIKRTNWS